MTLTAEDDKPPFETTTLWDYPKQSYGRRPKGNNKFQGVTPAFIIWNMLQRYTKPGGLVVDPMCGRGTTIDVCEEEGRDVIGYDMNPRHPKVIKNDSRKIPLEDNTVDMVFVDSPYGYNVNYSSEEADIGKLSAKSQEFYDELDNVGFEPVDLICVARRSQSSNTGLWHYRARRFNFFLPGLST